MTESLAHRFADWLHGTEADVAKRLADFENRLAKVEAALAADAPMVEKDVQATEAAVTQDVHDAGTVVGDVKQAAGA